MEEAVKEVVTKVEEESVVEALEVGGVAVEGVAGAEVAAAAWVEVESAVVAWVEVATAPEGAARVEAAGVARGSAEVDWVEAVSALAKVAAGTGQVGAAEMDLADMGWVEAMKVGEVLAVVALVAAALGVELSGEAVQEAGAMVAGAKEMD